MSKVQPDGLLVSVQTVNGSTLDAEVTDLTPGHQARVTVAAVNAVGVCMSDFESVIALTS